MEKYLDKNSVLRLLQGVKTQINKSKTNILDTKGVANGIASLDENGNVPLSQLGNVDNVLFEIVNVLPTELTEKQKNHIFIVPRGLETESNKNTYKEYIYTGEDLGHIDQTYWEELGEFTSEVDLKPYSKKSETVTTIRFTSENSSGTSDSASPDQNLLIEFADGHHVVVDVPIAGADGYTSSGHGYVGNCGFMTNSDKGKLDKIDLEALTASINAANTAANNTNKTIQAANIAINNTNTAIKAAETATLGAEKVDATITEGNVFEVTDRTGTKKSLDMSGVVSAQNTIKELQDFKVDKNSIVQEFGNSEDKIISQKAVSDKLNYLSNNIIGFSKSFVFDKESHYSTSLKGVTLNKGQYAIISIKTTPAITTTYLGNVSNVESIYPSIKIKNGFGKVIIGPAISDGAEFSYFGYGSANDVPIKHTADFTIFVIESADEIPTKLSIQKNTEDIQKNTEDIQKNTEDIVRVISELNIPFIEKHIEYNFSESTYVCTINTGVIKSGQYIKVKVKTTPAINNAYSGNATDMTQKYPSINIKNGVGETIIGPATSDNGILLNFGYGSGSNIIPHKAEFIISVLNSSDSDITTLKEQVQKNTDNIQKNLLVWLQEGILQSNVIDLTNGNFRTTGYTPIIRDWGFIGDSLSSGEMECFDGQTRKWIDIYEYSWGQQICRLCGSNGYNYSSAGQTTKGWITGGGDRTWNKAKTTKHQAYIIALGVNDITNGVQPGNIDTDIDISNYNNNADTFAGNYGGIIQRVRSVSERSIIFVVLMPRDDDKAASMNAIIKGIANKFKNIFIIDLSQLSELYKSTYFHKKYYMNNHLNAAGYLFTAYLFMHYIDVLIQENVDSFRDIALWNTNYTAQDSSENIYNNIQ